MVDLGGGLGAAGSLIDDYSSVMNIILLAATVKDYIDELKNPPTRLRRAYRVAQAFAVVYAFYKLYEGSKILLKYPKTFTAIILEFLALSGLVSTSFLVIEEISGDAKQVKDVVEQTLSKIGQNRRMGKTKPKMSLFRKVADGLTAGLILASFFTGISWRLKMIRKDLGQDLEVKLTSMTAIASLFGLVIDILQDGRLSFLDLVGAFYTGVTIGASLYALYPNGLKLG